MRIRYTSLASLFALLVVIPPWTAQAQPIELTWDLKWINPQAYLGGIGEVYIIPEWRKSLLSRAPVIGFFSDDQQQWVDAINNTIYAMDSNYSLVLSQPLVPTDQSRRASAMSEDGSTLALSLDEEVGGRVYTSIYLRTRNESGLFSGLQHIYRPARPLDGIFSLRLSADGNTLAWTEDRSIGVTLLVMSNLHSQPVISEVMSATDLTHETLQLSADGQWIFILSRDSGFDLQQGLRNVNLFSRFTDGEWSAARYVRVDGAVYRSAVEDVNSDGSFIQIGAKVAYREGDEYRTLYDFEPTRFDKLGGSMSEDGRSVVFLSGDEDPWDSLDPRERSRIERTSIPERDLVLVTFDPNRAEPVQTYIIDTGFRTQFYYKKDGSRLVWTKQEEDPYRDIVEVGDWSERGEN